MERNLSQIYWPKDRQKFLGKGERDFDAQDVRLLFKVRPDLSDLVPSMSVSCAFSEAYTEINFAQACLVDGSIIIQDVNPLGQRSNEELNNQVRALNEISQSTVQVVDARKQTGALVSLIKNLRIENPLYIFPGNGARVVSEYIKSAEEFLDISKAVYLPTTRIKIKPGRFDLKIDYGNLPDQLPKNIVIVDDVIASGQTIDTLAFKLKLIDYESNIVTASWICVFGAYLSEDINQSITSLALKGNYAKNPPINSLSCLISSDAKYDETKISYAEKYFKNPKQLQEFLERFRQV